MVITLEKLPAKPTITVSVVDYRLYEDLIRSIRKAVFVNEQCIPAAIEKDSDDLLSQHVLACCGRQVVGTGRLTPKGRIGRVAVSRPIRRRGVGFSIMQKLLEVAQQDNHQAVVLAAQYHAIKFYEKLGFRREGDAFTEVGIMHVMMRKQLTASLLSDQWYAS
ncbi:GNAT family N-acetyltransferase [Oscillatoria sp. CS-180]|uniref:GNAT family N-acetyltransferase n=1 Tax=Oscillatoria sp. CS-180 TaxID=3021720 RepID=UPI00232EBC78|nr:GNAT family N-acetyltransferase [Oscillatoria sp. CS-180]MDB9529391.1 GNAT family N-acetyltransferase [Oscillatoria sp. CS-180]